MRIVTNAGVNLPPAAVARYSVHLSPQRLVVDGVQYDTRRTTFADIDHWVATAKQPAQIVGTTPAELVAELDQIARTDDEILVLTTTRKGVSTYDAAVAAKRVLSEGARPPQIAVVDLETVDIGATLLALAALHGAAQGRDLDALQRGMYRAVSASATFLFPADIARFAKDPRGAAMVARAEGATPVLQVEDGELMDVASVKHGEDPVPVIADKVVAAVGAGSKVWLGLTHDGDARRVEALKTLLAGRLDVQFWLVQEQSAALYLRLGMKSFAVSVLPVASLAWPVDGQPL